MINLFEFQNKVDYFDSFDELEEFLDIIWKQRDKNNYFQDFYTVESDTQKFLKIFRKTKQIKSNKYVGVIYFQDQKINLLPKIFFNENKKYTESEILQIQNHLLWYLSYCRKIKFPSYLAKLGASSDNFLEIIIFAFSKYTHNLLNSLIFQQFSEFQSNTSFIKGKVNFNNYVTENISKANFHKVSCVCDEYDINNEFNRIVKYVCNLLFSFTQNSDSKKYLSQILFILHEVGDEKASAEQCKKFTFNPFFSNFDVVRDYCELFLTNCISYDYKNSLKLFAFLLPMDYIYEDFIYGFIKKELPAVDIQSQKSNTFLDEGGTFNLKPDLFLRLGRRVLIADTKYKSVFGNQMDAKNGMSQNDLYQMLAYAVRFKVDIILLFYPNTILSNKLQESRIIIKDALAHNHEISVFAYQLPLIEFELLRNDHIQSVLITDLFSNLRSQLQNRLGDIFYSFTVADI